MAGVCRPLSICARTVGGAALFVGVVLVRRVQLINQSMFAGPLHARADGRCARAQFISFTFFFLSLVQDTTFLCVIVWPRLLSFSVSPPSAPAIRDTYSLFD